MSQFLYVSFVFIAIVSASKGDRPLFNATVSKDKPGAYRTITEALDVAPKNLNVKYVIHVEAGVYVERVVVPKYLTNIVLVGDGAVNTFVRFNRHAPTFDDMGSATIVVEGDGFVAKFITFENTAGQGFPAPASGTTASNVAYYRCIFKGYQDTLYAKKGTQFYRECDIYGTVDFIFGRAAAVFQGCNLYARVPRTITFTAQNKIQARGISGFVIQNCNLTVAPGLESQRARFQGFLGRPWSNLSTVIIMESYLDTIIQPDGWQEWPPRGTDSVTYLEFNNRGPGASTEKRVRWAGYRDVTGHPEMVRRFTVGEFINTGDWIGKAGIPHSDGFIYV
ncbi:hypothetical protein CASFOL_038565 [Castilleja foliolosa]|uniref:Pectinesterase n=1 Tax=Castilleja foliolosa TaxID=1961234 RepID=A0ABD3BM04_9LAMI